MRGTGPLLIIDNFDSFTQNLAQMAEEEGAQGIEVVREDLLDPADAGRFPQILISPGPGLPSDFPRMLEVIRRFGSSRSILGICLGHQAIAEVFGGKLKRMEQVRHGTAVEMHVIAGDPLFAGLPAHFTVGLYHSWAVDEKQIPADILVTGRSDEGVVMAISHRDFRVKGVQFHPESIMTPQGRRLLRNWLEVG